MGLLMPVGTVLIVVGLAGSVGACYQAGLFDSPGRAGAPSASAGAAVTKNTESPVPMVVAPLAGLVLAAGVVFVGVGMGHWRRPVPSDTRPANPWSDQPGEHGDPPKGLV